jgi:hypothetical protein
MTGYDSKRKMAADKFIAAEERKVGERYGYVPKLHPSEWMNAQPAQEPVGTLNISRYKGHLVNHDFDYFGELPDGTYSVYTTPPLPVQEPEMLTIVYQSGYHDGKQAALAGREWNFCERCGKRTKDLTVIHTCTPPQGDA